MEEKDSEIPEKSFEEKIKEDIMKSGFPLELETSSTLENNGWAVSPNEYVVEPKTEKEYEIDLLASKCHSSKTKDEKYKFVSYFNLIVECKKSEKHPWVFFLREKVPFDFPARIIKHSHNFGVNKPFRIDNNRPHSDLDYFEKNIDYSQLNIFSWKKISTNYCVAFRNPDEENQIYKAVKSLVKPLKLLKNKDQGRYSGGRWTNIVLKTYILIIVLDGNLFEGTLKKRVLKIKKTKYIPLLVNTGDSSLPRILISIVRKDYLSDFIKKINQDLITLHKEFLKISYTDSHPSPIGFV